MKRFLVACLVVMALSGCAAPQPEAPMMQPPTVAAEPEIAPLGVQWDAPPENLHGLQFVLAGNATETIDLEITGVQGAPVKVQIEPGAWTVDLALPDYGSNTIRVDAQGNRSGLVLDWSINAWAPATVDLDYGATSSRATVTEAIWVNLIEFASAPAYEERDIRRAEYATVHDVMAALEQQTGHVVEYGYNEGFGSFSVERIDGEGNQLSAGEPPWWCYRVNGERAGQGISSMPFAPGDVVAWDLGNCQ